jgi:lipoyl(octanoyl) transferase
LHHRTLGTMIQELTYIDLGLKDYKETWDLQEQLLREGLDIKSEARAQNITNPFEVNTQHYLLFVEHPPVYTLGKSGQMEHVLISDSEREEKNIQFFKINRGGDITYHGPQQLVGYPILDLEKSETDIGKYLRNLEQVIIDSIAEYGIKGDRLPGETGVWLDPHIKGKERKICAMGVRCSRWITMHGFALNVNNDLSYFNHIVPCGIPDKQVTSIKNEIGRDVPMAEIKAVVLKQFLRIFNFEIKNPSE